MKAHRVLLVDDDPISLQLMQSYLKPKGYAISTATNGEQAEQLIGAHPAQYFSAIVLNFRMPGKDGVTLLTELKQGERCLVPIILQTSANDPKQIKAGIDAGAFYYLIKPYTPKVFLSIVDSAIKDFSNHQLVTQKLAKLTNSMRLLKDAHFEFRTLEEATNLSSFIAHLTQDPKKVGLGLFELLVNAVEHGNLEISYDEKTELLNQARLKQEIDQRLQLAPFQQRYVKVDIAQHAGDLVISIEDMGKGFDFEQYLEFSVERALDNHGRGIMMANKLSFDSLQYSLGGRRVTAIHHLGSS
jgi:DNA-binding response OmpR family regulator